MDAGKQLLEPDRVTLGDLLAHKGDGAPAALVSAAPGQLVRQALGLMRLHDVSQLPVLEGGECVGSVTEYALTQLASRAPASSTRSWAR